MDTTRAEYIALDDALVAPANRLKIGKRNFRLSSDLKSKEATLQVVYDVLKLTPLYKAFQISVDVPKIYMQEFWGTPTVHHHSIRFKMNNKTHIVNLECFREMLQICPKLPNQQFEELPFKEAILTFLRDLGHIGEIKMITDVNVNRLHQPWRSFAAGIYHKKKVDYAYLLWEDFFYQVENKNVKKSNEMYYLRLTKVIINFFMAKDQSIPRRNSVNWHYDRDDYMFTTIKVVSRHEDTQLYGAILPNELTNKDIRNSESYKEYYAIASGAEPPKTKATKPVKKKQPAKTSMDKGLIVLSEVALTQAEQLKLVIERSNTQTHSSHASGSGVDKGTGSIPGVPDVPTYDSDDDQITWNSSEEDYDDEVNDDDNSDDEDDDNTDDQDDDNQDDDDEGHDDQDADAIDDQDNDDQDAKNPDDDNEQTDSYNNDDDEEVQGMNFEGEEMDEEANNEEGEGNELYKDLNVNLEGRDVEMTNAQPTNSSSVSSGFVSNMLNPRPDTGIDLIFTLNTEETSLVDVSVTTIAEPPLVSATTLPPPPTPLITHMQQTSVPTPTTIPRSSLQDLPNLGSFFRFDHRLKTLETDFFEFKQTNQFAEAVSSIPSIIDVHLANKMNEAIKIAIQLQSNKLRDETLAENEAFLNSLDDNIKKIINGQVKQQVKAQVSKILPRIEKIVNEQIEVEVMTRSSTESKTSLAIAANLSEFELIKILIDKMESNKSIHISNEQKNLYKALVEAYESDKLILDTYSDIVSFKRCRDDEDKDEEPFAGSNRGSTERSKSQHKSAGESAHAEEPMHTTKDLEEPTHQEFDIGATKDQSDEETSQHPDWFQNLAKLPTPNRDWNKTLPAIHGPIQPWLSNMAQEEGPRKSFDELMDTPLDFSAFMMNRLKIDTLTPELLASPTFKLMKGTYKSLVELEYFFEEVYKATTDQLDWHNPEGQQYPHDLRKPLPLIPNSRGRQVIPFNHFINNDLAYQSIGVSSRTYATSATKTKAAYYGHIKWIEDLVPNIMWSEVPVNYDKHVLWGISHWGRKRQQFYRFAANRESARDVYSKHRIIAEGDFKRLRLQDIEDMLILLVQGKLTNLNVEDRLAFGVSLRISDLKRRDAYTAYSNPRGFIYQKKDKKNKLVRIDELHKFSNGTLDDVRTVLNDRLKGIRMEYLPKTIWRHSDGERAKAMIYAIDKQPKSRRIMQSLEKFVGGRPYKGDLRLLQRTI
ncbi:hypothetical protein Tco_0275822 [Tanacetum coccineum]